MNPNLEKKLLIIKKNMIEELQESWNKVIDLSMSDRRIYYYEGKVDVILKYYKTLFDDDLCKETASQDTILDIEKVQNIYKKILSDIKEGKK